MILNILDIKVKLVSNDIKFLEFVKSSTNSISKFKSYDVLINVYFNRSLFSVKKNFDISERISEYYGSELFVNENSIFWKSKKLKVFVEKKSSKYKISANSNFRLDQKIRFLFSVNPEFENNLFLYVYRFTVLYPVIALLSNKNKASLIHASAVLEKNTGKALLFVGLNGVGKSSLAFNLSNTKYFELLSDNFVLISKNNMKIIPELLRLPFNKTGSVSDFIGKANKKYLFKNNNISLKDYEVDKMFFISRDTADKPSQLLKLSNKKSFNLLCNIGNYLKEYENFHYSAFMEVEKLTTDLNNYKYLSHNCQNFIFKIGNEKNNETKFLQLFKS